MPKKYRWRNSTPFSKYLVQTYPRDIARFTLEREDVEVLELLDTDQTTLDARRPDSLLRVRLGGEVVVVHTEFQTTGSTPPMPQRMAGYIWRLIEQYGLPVRSSVVYLRPDAGRNDPGYYLQSGAGHRVFFEYRVIRLSQMEGQPILEAGPAGLIPFAPLMKPPQELAAEEWLRRCVQTAREQRLDRPAREDLVGGLSLLSQLAYSSQTVFDIISKEGIMDLIRESPLARLLAQEGREQGREEGLRESIRDVLEIRFAVGATHPLAARLEAIGDLHRLRQLHRAAIQVDCLEEFRRLAEAEEQAPPHAEAPE